MRRLRRLVQKRSLRWSEGSCVLEGPDLVLAGLAAGAEFEAIYVDEAASSSEPVAAIVSRAGAAGVRVFWLAKGVLERVADASTPQPVIAAVRLGDVDVEEIDAGGLVLVAHDVRDPGNAGTLVRSADATGAAGVVFTGHSVDPFNPKTLRATAGSIFHVPIAVGELASTLRSFEDRGASTYASVVRGGLSYRDVDYASAVVVLGNESEGLDQAAIALCGATLSIEMVGRSESLNVGVAGSLIAFEAMSQRRSTNGPLPAPSL